MKRMNWILTLLLTGSFVLQACGAVVAPEPNSMASENSQPAPAAQAAAPVEEQSLRVRDNDADADAPGVLVIQDPVEVAANGPTVTVSQATNCRTGPSKDYDLVALFEANQSAEVVAVYPFGPYAVVDNPNGAGNCWLWLEHANPSDFSGFDLPEAETPPPPEPKPEAFDWSGYWTAWIETESFTFYVYVNGQHFTGQFIDGYGKTITISGQIDDDGDMVNGTWVWGDRSSTFRVLGRKGDGTFVGSWGPGLGAFCGARRGNPQPWPCLGP